MPTLISRPAGAAARWDVVARARAALDALEHLVGGLGTAVLALVALLWLVVTALTCLVGVGLLLVPAALRVAARRRRPGTRPAVPLGAGDHRPGPAPAGLRAAVARPRRPAGAGLGGRPRDARPGCSAWSG